MIRSEHEIFYIDRLAHHTNSITNKVNEFYLKQNALITKARIGSNGYQAAVEEALEILLEVMGHIAALSRYFWPASNNKLHKDRGKRLRDVYAIDENSQLKNRAARNAVEHFDERLDKLLASSPTSDILPSYFGSRVKLERKSALCFIGYLVDDQVIKILDAETKLSEVLGEVDKIQSTLIAQISNGKKF